MLNFLEGSAKALHRYYVYASGLKKFKPKEFDSRIEAEEYMQNVCKKNNLQFVECTEADKHERKYSNHRGVRFYINRI